MCQVYLTVGEKSKEWEHSLPVWTRNQWQRNTVDVEENFDYLESTSATRNLHLLQYAETSTCNSSQRQHSYNRVDEDHYEEIVPTQVALESLKEEMEEVQGLMDH